MRTIDSIQFVSRAGKEGMEHGLLIGVISVLKFYWRVNGVILFSITNYKIFKHF